MLDETVTAALTEKIQRQDRFIAELQAELQRARQASVDPQATNHGMNWW